MINKKPPKSMVTPESIGAKKISENEQCVFYTNELCKDYGDGFRIILAQEKSNGRMTYLLLENEKPVRESQSIETVDYYHLAIIKSRAVLAGDARDDGIGA